MLWLTWQKHNYCNQISPLKYFSSFKRDQTNSSLRRHDDDVIVTTTRDHSNLIPSLRYGQEQRAVVIVPDLNDSLLWAYTKKKKRLAGILFTIKKKKTIGRKSGIYSPRLKANLNKKKWNRRCLIDV